MFCVSTIVELLLVSVCYYSFVRLFTTIVRVCNYCIVVVDLLFVFTIIAPPFVVCPHAACYNNSNHTNDISNNAINTSTNSNNVINTKIMPFPFCFSSCSVRSCRPRRVWTRGGEA